MVGLGKPHLLAKFEYTSFSRCTNIKGEPQTFGGAPLAQSHVQFFFGVGSMMDLGKPLACLFEVATFSRCRNIEETQHFEELLSPRPHPLFLWV